MSFHWNLSSSSSEDDNDEEKQDDNGNDNNKNITNETASGLSFASLPSRSTTASLVGEKKDFSLSDDDDDDDEVDWEDAVVDSDDNGEIADNLGIHHENNLENDAKLPGASTNAINYNSSNTGGLSSSSNIMKSITNVRPVTIDMNDTTSSSKRRCKETLKQRKRSRQQYSFRSLPSNVQNLVKNLHQSHLLTLTGRAIQISRCCSDLQLMHVAHSLVPSKWALSSPPPLSLSSTSGAATSSNTVSLPPPAEKEVYALCGWFFNWINNVEQRRRQTNAANVAAGAPPLRKTDRKRRQPRQSRRCATSQATKMTSINNSNKKIHNCKGYGRTTPNSLLNICHYLSQQYDDNPQLLYNNDNNQNNGDNNEVKIFVEPTITEVDKAQILIAIARSLGWRARYVVNLTPMKQYLDVEHPLFLINSLRNVFEIVGNKQDKNNPIIKNDADNEHGNPNSTQKRRRTTTKQASNTTKAKKKHKDILDIERNKSGASDLRDSTTAATSSVGGTFAWVEILCTRDVSSSDKKQSKKAESVATNKLNHPRWIHIDPANELWNMPKKVEFFLPSSDSKTLAISAKKRRKNISTKSIISYALAVEHAMAYELLLPAQNDNDDNSQNGGSLVTADQLMNCLVRLTDVTPRYANAWSETLKQRGMTRKEMVLATSNNSKAKNNKNVNASWWADTIRKTNRLWRLRAKKLLWNNRPTPASSKKMVQLKDDIQGGTKIEAQDLMKSGGVKTMEEDQSPTVLTIKEDEESSVVILDNSSSEIENHNMSDSSQQAGADDKMDEYEERRGETDDAEQAELADCVSNESIPTSKTAFKNHPLYAISAVLNSAEVLAPDAKKRVCGLFKGELVYRRSDVSTALTAKQWLYKGRKVKEKETKTPVKRVKARKKPTPMGFQALKSYGMGSTNDGSEDAKQRDLDLAAVPLEEYDGMQDLYGIWQTRPWYPSRIGPNDRIPVNEYKNIELELMNPGLVHLEEPKMSVVAKKLSIPYAPCLLGFEGHGGNRTPTIRGIVVHEHNEYLLREAYAEFLSQAAEEKYANHQRKILKQWKRLIVGMLTKDRLEREYGDQV